MPRRGTNRDVRRTVAAVILCTLVAGPISIASAAEITASEEQAHVNPPAHFGYGAASVLATIPYGLAKLLYAGAGTVVGGLAYVFSKGDTAAAKAVWTASLRGTYVLTPEHLKGERDIHFIGVPDPEPMPQHVKVIVVEPTTAR